MGVDTNDRNGICTFTPTGHKIIEHRYHESLSKCLKAKRYAMKDKTKKDRVVYKCIQSKANVEVYMGEKKILSLILDQ